MTHLGPGTANEVAMCHCKKLESFLGPLMTTHQCPTNQMQILALGHGFPWTGNFALTKTGQFFIFIFVLLRIEPKALNMPDRFPTTAPHPVPAIHVGWSPNRFR